MPLIMDVFHPASYTVDHSLLGVQSHADLEIAHMWFTQSRDCAHALRNLGIPRMCNAISRLRKFPDCAEQIHTHVRNAFMLVWGLLRLAPIIACIERATVLRDNVMCVVQ